MLYNGTEHINAMMSARSGNTNLYSKSQGKGCPDQQILVWLMIIYIYISNVSSDAQQHSHWSVILVMECAYFKYAHFCCITFVFVTENGLSEKNRITKTILSIASICEPYFPIIWFRQVYLRSESVKICVVRRTSYHTFFVAENWHRTVKREIRIWQRISTWYKNASLN